MKINTAVKCINAWDSNNLSRGKVYTVVDVNQHGNIQVSNGEETLPHYYKPSRFEVVANPVRVPIDLTQKYQTRDGRPVTLFRFSNDKDFPLVGEVLEDGKWQNSTWTRYGETWTDRESSDDLVLVRKPYTLELPFNVFVKIYSDKSMLIKRGNSHELSLHKEHIEALYKEIQK